MGRRSHLVGALVTGCALVGALAGCGPTPPPVTPTRFHAVTDSGMQYRWEIAGPRPLNILQSAGNGCAFLDYDRDGNLDVLLVGMRPALFRGDGKGRFIPSNALPPLTGHFLGCAVGDVNNDGFPDLYLSGYGEGMLLRNDKGQKFADVSASWGVTKRPWGTSAAFADLDGDGWLDLYVAGYVRFREKSLLSLCPLHGQNGKTVLGSCPPTSYPPLQGVLYHNRSGRGFTDATAAAGLRAHTGNGLGVACADYDGTGLPGIAVANDMVDSDLFRNPGNGKLEAVGVIAGVARGMDGTNYAGMGLDWGDFDNDGRPDLAMTAFENQTKPLFRNEGDGLFLDVSRRAGTATASLTDMPFGCKFADFDNDGGLDLIFANGHVQDRIAEVNPRQTYRQRVRFFAGDGQGRFTDTTTAAGLADLPPVVGRGLATGDFDNDGRVDVLIADAEGEPLLLKNETKTENHWLGIRLVGAKSNRDGYGAIVTVESGGKKWVRHCHADGSYLSSSDPRVHFGVGTASRVDALSVRWPGGSVESFPAPLLNRYTILKQGTGKTEPPAAP